MARDCKTLCQHILSHDQARLAYRLARIELQKSRRYQDDVAISPYAASLRYDNARSLVDTLERGQDGSGY